MFPKLKVHMKELQDHIYQNFKLFVIFILAGKVNLLHLWPRISLSLVHWLLIMFLCQRKVSQKNSRIRQRLLADYIFWKSNKFLFGAGISIYKMQSVDNTTVIKPFVDDVNCIGSIFNLALSLIDSLEVYIWLAEGVM